MDYRFGKESGSLGGFANNKLLVKKKKVSHILVSHTCFDRTKTVTISFLQDLLLFYLLLTWNSVLPTFSHVGMKTSVKHSNFCTSKNRKETTIKL